MHVVELDTYTLNSGSTQFESWPGYRLSCPSCSGFPQSLQANSARVARVFFQILIYSPFAFIFQY